MGMLLFARCKQTYDPQVKEQNVRLLVVEGFINSGQNPTVIHLSRTVNLKDTMLSPETGAQVNVEDENGGSVALTETAIGEYSISQLALDNNLKYKLHIKTSDGREYASDYAAVKQTPPIDSITWQKENGGVQIYVNTHNDQHDTGYYRWAYSETWEFHSAYLSYLDWTRDPVTHDAIEVKGRSNTDSLYKCWKTQNSTNLILGSSEKLSTDKIFLPIRYIEPMGEELSVRYYIELTQYALGQQEYLFYQRLKKNTEELGSIFDPQPSELSGNIHCTSNPDEVVIGYVGISEEQKAHLFITNEQVAPWVTPTNCSKIILYNDPDSVKPYGDIYIPLHGVTFRGLMVVTFDAAVPVCVDCTLRGTNIKPSFWP